VVFNAEGNEKPETTVADPAPVQDSPGCQIVMNKKNDLSSSIVISTGIRINHGVLGTAFYF
jgi:hypothetical protein